jgi:hypothetical protein
MQIKWLPLRLNILPLIHKQVKHVLDLFLLTRAEIQEGDILSLEHLKNMRQEVKQSLFRSRNASRKWISSTASTPWTPE